MENAWVIAHLHITRIIKHVIDVILDVCSVRSSSALCVRANFSFMMAYVCRNVLSAI